MKGGELAKRAEKREVAAKELAAAEEKGDAENIEKFSKRCAQFFSFCDIIMYRTITIQFYNIQF